LKHISIPNLAQPHRNTQSRPKQTFAFVPVAVLTLLPPLAPLVLLIPVFSTDSPALLLVASLPLPPLLLHWIKTQNQHAVHEQQVESRERRGISRHLRMGKSGASWTCPRRRLPRRCPPPESGRRKGTAICEDFCFSGRNL
jgi:hypothetical protein